MPKSFNVLAELTSAVISIIVGIPLEHGHRLSRQIIEKKILIKKIRKREVYLKEKYKNSFEFLKDMGQGSLFQWLKEENTIKRILSFSNSDDTCNISIEQMQHCKEIFFIDAFNMAQIHDWHKQNDLRKILNELFQYVDELFWQTSDKKNIFLYKKCVLEIKRQINEYTEKTIQEIHYHDSFAEYINNQKVLQKIPFKLDYRSGEIPFVGRAEELKEIDTFCASEVKISWWAVIGKGGSGKSRLAYHYIEKNINSLDWKMCFLHDEFFYQVDGGGKYKHWNIWTYNKNLLLVVDYVQKYAKEVAQWIEGLSNNNSVTQKIRILLLERTGGEKSLWYQEGFQNRAVDSLKYEKDYLELQSNDSDLIQFATEYAEKSKKKISKIDAIDALTKLKTIDPDARILYFIMILEAIFSEKSWRSWNQIDLADYIVKREKEDISRRFKNDKDMIQSFNKLLAFCTATKGISIFDPPQTLPKFIKKEIKKISNKPYAKQELCAIMQLENDILQPITPDIIGEYMVLNIIDQYFFTKEEKENFIKSLWAYDSDNFLFFVFHLFQDKLYDKFYDSIIKLMLFDAIPNDIHVIENYSRLMCGLTAISDLGQIFIYIEILENLYHVYSYNRVISYSYARGLVNLSYMQKLPEIGETIEKLKILAKKHIDNPKIQTTYAMGLNNLGFVQELPKIKKTIKKLEAFSQNNTNNPEIPLTYAIGLFTLSNKQKMPERKKTIEKLEIFTGKHISNPKIQIIYASGLFNLSCNQELPERKETIKKLEMSAENNTNNPEIQKLYAKGLCHLSYNQELPDKRETIEKLEQLSIRYAGNPTIEEIYAKSLSDLIHTQYSWENKEIVKKLELLSKKHSANPNVQAAYTKGLLSLSPYQTLPEILETIEILKQYIENYTDNVEFLALCVNGLAVLSRFQELSEQKETVELLMHFARNHADNVNIQVAYAKGIFHLCDKQKLSEKKETTRILMHLARKYTENIEIQIIYAKSLVNLICEQELLGKKEVIEELEILSKNYAKNVTIQVEYAKGLFYRSKTQKMPEMKEIISKLKNLVREYNDNDEILTAYAKGLFYLNRQNK